MTAKQIKPIRLFHFEFKDHIEACLSMVRMQEFYESPKFRNKFFTIDDYINWWCRQGKDKSFDYMNEVAGYNIPGDKVVRWIKEFYFDTGYDVSDRELAVLNKLESLGVIDWEAMNRGKNPTDFYIIGTCKGISNPEGYLAHEIRHAMFYLIPEYRDGMMEVIGRFPCNQFRKKLLNDKDVSYHKSVINDEVHAYALTGYDPYYECKIGKLPKELQNIRKELKKVERQFIKKGKIHVPRREAA